MELDKNCHPSVFAFYFVVLFDFAATTELEKGLCFSVFEDCSLILSKIDATNDFLTDYGKSSSIYHEKHCETSSLPACGSAIEIEPPATKDFSTSFDMTTVCAHVPAVVDSAQVSW
jgi:hypothetical protein